MARVRNSAPTPHTGTITHSASTGGEHWEGWGCGAVSLLPLHCWARQCLLAHQNVQADVAPMWVTAPGTCTLYMKQHRQECLLHCHTQTPCINSIFSYFISSQCFSEYFQFGFVFIDWKCRKKKQSRFLLTNSPDEASFFKKNNLNNQAMACSEWDQIYKIYNYCHMELVFVTWIKSKTK